MSNHSSLLQLIQFALLFYLILPSAAKQTVFLEKLSGRNDRIIYQLLQQTNDYVEYNRFLGKFQYKCRAIISNQLTKNRAISLKAAFPHSLYYRDVMAIEEKYLQGKRIDKLLDLLAGQCIYHTTATFLYEYCHKEHVRQFDSLSTKIINSKPEFEDISMGVFYPERYEVRKARMSAKEKESVKPRDKESNDPPPHSNFSADYNFLTVEDIDNLFGELELQQSEDGSLLFANAHLGADDTYITNGPLFVAVRCEDESGREFTSHAMMVAPYTLLYTKKRGTCHNFIDYTLPTTNIEYYPGDSAQPIRIYGSYLYGNVEEVCTANWAWQRSYSDSDVSAHLEEGSLLQIYFYNKALNATERLYRYVKRIVNSELIELSHVVGKSFKFVPQYETEQSWSHVVINKISECKMIFNKTFDVENNVNFAYLGHSIATITRANGKIRIGDNFGCVCKKEKPDIKRPVDLGIRVVGRLMDNTYQVHITTNTKIYQPSYFMEHVIADCQYYQCRFFTNHTKTKQFHRKMFTNITKISSNHPSFKFPKELDSFYYAITIKGGGVMKLTTRAQDGVVYTYLLTEGQLIKLVEFANGTKEIIRENRYYENMTLPTDTLYQNYIYIKANTLPNGTLITAIWKHSDNVFMPRFQMVGERPIELFRLGGYAYIRIFNLQRMRRKKSMAIVKWMQLLQDHYFMEEKIKNQQASLLLNSSYSIKYIYSSGDYCGTPVNKKRTTTVTIKCGNPWFHINTILEFAPCEYWVQVESALLCDEGHKDVLEKDEELFRKSEEDRMSTSGVVCFPSKGLLDQTGAYIYTSSLLRGLAAMFSPQK